VVATTPKSAKDACSEVKSILNRTVARGEHLGELAHMLDQNYHVPDEELPLGVALDSSGTTLVADTVIYGRRLKVVSYSSLDTDPFIPSRILEMWTPDFKTRINIPSRDESGWEDPGALEDDLILLRGKPYFIQSGRESGVVFVTGFERDLTAKQVCVLKKSVRSQPEHIESATSPAVCRAALRDNVEDAGLDSIEPYDLTREALAASGWDRLNVKIVSKGTSDLDNDGQPEMVGMAVNEVSVHRTDYYSQWPVILDENGAPAPATPLNQVSFEHAGSDASARLFRFRGVTYFERRSKSELEVPSHEIWKFTRDSATRICIFAFEVAASFEIQSHGKQ
jgi:hypothetical protein